MSITTTVEGLERYPVNLRYSRELRDNIDAIEACARCRADGRQVPLGQVAAITTNKGPWSSAAKTAGPMHGYLWISGGSTSDLYQ